jgi:hypothetical protein
VAPLTATGGPFSLVRGTLGVVVEESVRELADLDRDALGATVWGRKC